MWVIKMKSKKINLVEQFSKAKENIKKLKFDEISTECLNLLKTPFEEMENVYIDFCKSNNQVLDNMLFDCFQELFIFFIIPNGTFNKNNYEIYNSFCEYKNIEALTEDKVIILRKKLTKQHIAENIKLLSTIRKSVTIDSYASLTQLFVYLSLFNGQISNDLYKVIIKLYNKDDIICSYEELLNLF